MRLTAIPLVTALLPALGVHVCWVVASSLGHLSWCVPYLPDCVSISATGRHPPESIIFRAAVIPTAVLMLIYWPLCHAWLKALGAGPASRNRAMLALGLVAGLGLFVYATILGEVGDLYKLQRRIGMIGFYISTFLAQALLTVQVRTARATGAPVGAGSLRAMSGIAGAVGVLGTLSLLSWAFYDDYRRFEDAFEWTITVLILAHPLASYFAWRESGFRARLTVSGGSA